MRRTRCVSADDDGAELNSGLECGVFGDFIVRIGLYGDARGFDRGGLGDYGCASVVVFAEAEVDVGGVGEDHRGAGG